MSGTYSSYSSSISVDTLTVYLMERCERNAEVRVLLLGDCYYISPGDVKKLLSMLSGMGYSKNSRTKTEIMIIMEIPLITIMIIMTPLQVLRSQFINQSRQSRCRHPAQFGLPTQMSASLPILLLHPLQRTPLHQWR